MASAAGVCHFWHCLYIVHWFSNLGTYLKFFSHKETRKKLLITGIKNIESGGRNHVKSANNTDSVLLLIGMWFFTLYINLPCDPAVEICTLTYPVFKKTSIQKRDIIGWGLPNSNAHKLVSEWKMEIKQSSFINMKLHIQGEDKINAIHFNKKLQLLVML